MTFLIKKRINTEQFIDRKVALYKGETRIRVGVNDDYQPVTLVDWRIEFHLSKDAFLISKGVGMRDQVQTLSSVTLQ